MRNGEQHSHQQLRGPRSDAVDQSLEDKAAEQEFLQQRDAREGPRAGPKRVDTARRIHREAHATGSADQAGNDQHHRGTHGAAEQHLAQPASIDGKPHARQRLAPQARADPCHQQDGDHRQRRQPRSVEAMLLQGLRDRAIDRLAGEEHGYERQDPPTVAELSLGVAEDRRHATRRCG